MTPETPAPADLARLLLDAAPQMELIERVAPHLPHLRPLLPMLAPGRWAEVERDLGAARAAPAHLQASFHRAVFAHLAQTHGGSEALWGALAHEMRQRAAQAPAAEGQKASRKVVHTEQECAEMHRVLAQGQRLMQVSPQTPEELSALFASRCGVEAHPKALVALKSGRYLRELAEDGWPRISAARAGELVTGLELLSGCEGES